METLRNLNIIIHIDTNKKSETLHFELDSNEDIDELLNRIRDEIKQNLDIQED